MGSVSRAFGDVWKGKPVLFWDRMWSKHSDSEMTTAIVDCVVESRRVVEIGCGAGHLMRHAVSRGWRGHYCGIDISETALDHARAALKKLPAISSATWHSGDFFDIACKGLVPDADLVISRGVVQHQAHWMPMVLTALRYAPVVAMGIGYTTDQADRHVGGWHKAGHFDWRVSLPCLLVEAKAVGLPIPTITKYPNPQRPRHQEALAVFTPSS